MNPTVSYLLPLLLLGTAWRCIDGATTEFEILVPDNVKVVGQDAYICTTLELPNKPAKLVGVEPLAKQEVVHHILLFGCDVPHSKPKPGQQSTWDCKMAPTCGGFSETIMYGWGRDAPRLDLPRGVGFSVGKGSAVAWVVAQVHYLAERPPGDKSGVRLTLQDNPVPYSAGLLSYASWFSIPPRKQHFLVQNSCCYKGFQPLTSFAVRVHTHTMGRAVFMTRLPPKGQGHGHVVAAGDPLKPQGFNPVASQVLWPGDHLTVACDFDSSDKTVAVGAGPTHEHEMCNMYLMVYSALPHIEMCSDGASMVSEYSPGNIPRAALLLPDPFPLWKPPKPTDKFNESVVGNVASVSVGPDGTLWALHRGGRVWGPNTFDDDNTITEKMPIAGDVVVQMHPDTGKVLRRWGAGHFFMPHMITVDRNNSVWIADVGRHQVLKFTASGQFILAVGQKNRPGDKRALLCKPTQVAFMNDGSFLVSDGYCNSRVMRYNYDGTFHSQYTLPDRPGGPSNPTGGGKGMGVAHSLVLDECDNVVEVADRETGRVHRFDLNTKDLITSVQLAEHGKVWALAKGPYGRTIALTWRPGQEASLVDVASPSMSWKLPNSTNLWPHDMAIGPAPLALTGAGDRLLAVYIAPLCEACGPVQKYVLFPKSFGVPDKALPPPVVAPSAAKPVLSHLHVGGHSAILQAQAVASAKTAGGGAPVADDVPEDGEVTEENEKDDEAEEERVEAEEEAEDEAEAKELADPATIERLQAELEDLHAQLKTYQDDEEHDTEEYTSVRFAGGRFVSGQHGLGGVVAVIAVSVLLGVAVGAFAVHTVMLGKHASARSRGQQGGAVGPGAVGPAYALVQTGEAARQQARQVQHQSIDSMLQELDDLEVAERDKLLSNGLQSSPSRR